mmetsp:Transcript_37483/g.100420  ORF Transcript_37483/g.100420 Transcript_37483/m.100420 type:complete len:232 (-) Transcript_37483:808-1503(-)
MRGRRRPSRLREPSRGAFEGAARGLEGAARLRQLGAEHLGLHALCASLHQLCGHLLHPRRGAADVEVVPDARLLNRLPHQLLRGDAAAALRVLLQQRLPRRGEQVAVSGCLRGAVDVHGELDVGSEGLAEVHHGGHPDARGHEHGGLRGGLECEDAERGRELDLVSDGDLLVQVRGDLAPLDLLHRALQVVGARRRRHRVVARGGQAVALGVHLQREVLAPRELERLPEDR